MLNRKKLLLILFAMHYALFTSVWAGSVEAKVSNTEIVAGNMAQLMIKATGDKAVFPDIKNIDGVPVVGKHQQQNNSFTYINGKLTNDRSITAIYSFSPQKDIHIPSYEVTVDGTVYKTDPLTIKVVKASVPQSNGVDQFSLYLRSNKKSVVVGEPLVATVYFSLHHGVRLADNPQYSKPDFKGFFAKEIGEEKHYNEGNRQVTELRYLLIPEKAGSFTVGPASAKIAIRDRSRRDMFGRYFGTNWHPIASNTVHIEVKPLPKEADLVGNFRIESTIDKERTKANKPVNLTVTIEGEGNLEDYVFPEYEIDGVTIYSDDAKVETELIGKKIRSTYVKSFAFISDEDFTIPARTISVYDTKSAEVKRLKIPEYTVHITSKKAAVHKEHASAPSAKNVVQTNLKSSMLEDEASEAPQKEVKDLSWWMLLLAFIAGGAVVTLLRSVTQKKWKRESSPYKESEALKILYPHINESAEIEAMVRQLYAKKNGDKNVKIDKKRLKEMVESLKQ